MELTSPVLHTCLPPSVSQKHPTVQSSRLPVLADLQGSGSPSVCPATPWAEAALIIPNQGLYKPTWVQAALTEDQLSPPYSRQNPGLDIGIISQAHEPSLMLPSSSIMRIT